MAKGHPDWHRSLASVKRSLTAVSDLVSIVNERVDLIYEKLKIEDQARQKMGEHRFKYCMFLVNGYCEERTHEIVDPTKTKVTTTQRKGKYYPAITWEDCSRCDHGFFV